MNAASRVHGARLAVALVSVCAACGVDDEASVTYDPRACSEWDAVEGFGLRWANANHRVSLWRVLTADPEACGSDGVELAYVGGDWTTGAVAADVPTATVSARRIVDATPDELGVYRDRVRLDIDPSGAATADVVVDRNVARLLGYPELTAVIDGLEIDTNVPQSGDYPADYDPSLGYTLRRVGADVEVVTADATTATVRVSARLAFGASDRDPMNRALLEARSAVTVGLALVGTQREAADADVDYALEYPRQLFGEDPVHEPAAATEAVVTLPGRAGDAEGVVAFRGFDFDLSAHGECGATQICPTGDTCVDGTCVGPAGPAGFYIRELRIGARVVDVDEAGTADVWVDGFASNASSAIAYFALRSHFSATVVRFPVASEPLAARVEFETGETRASLDSDPSTQGAP
ncbi:MAG: hypothetical protein H6698_07740 [Myxococcales bacterium]|nr:hypothetical protein [Myxococcales bacterium]MCB9534180.1 hypothetical protein [Myxococcales bacterium]